MKRFAFRLERLLELRRMREGAAKRELGAELKVRHDRAAELEAAGTQNDRLRQAFFRLDRSGRLDIQLFRRFQTYQNVLTWAVKHAQVRVAEQDKEVDKARVRLQEARCQTRILERMREVRLEAYARDLKREDVKVMGEFAMGRHARQQGGVLQVYLAVTSACFVTSLLILGIMMGMGYLKPEKMRLVGLVMTYDRSAYPQAKDPQPLHLVAGEDLPYVIHASTVRNLKKIIEQYRQERIDHEDDREILTQEVLKKRKDIVGGVQAALREERQALEKTVADLARREADLAAREKTLKEEREAFEGRRAKATQEKLSKAQEEVMASFKGMDPEEIAKILTNNNLFEAVTSEAQRRETAAYAAGYLLKMGGRQRSAVLEAMGPKWSRAVASHLEGAVPPP